MDEEASLSNEPPTENEKPQPQPQDGPHGVPIIRNSEFQNADGFDICCKSWLTETRPRGLVFMVHGYSEHCHRPHYDTLATALVALGCCVFTQDLGTYEINAPSALLTLRSAVGHGKSSGPRAFVKSIDTYVEDVLKQADVTRRRFPRKPVYLFGYDMGGVISVLAAQRRPFDFAGIALMSPLMAFAKQRVTWLKVAQDKARTLELPLLVLVGSDDQLGDPDAIKAFFQETSSKDKTMKVSSLHEFLFACKMLTVYNGAYHNLLTEPGGIKEQALKDITDWFEARLPSILRRSVSSLSSDSKSCGSKENNTLTSFIKVPPQGIDGESIGHVFILLVLLREGDMGIRAKFKISILNAVRRK
ncbi:hypothetical protein HPB48_018274 [Haemaphysalis longicornis]|uniref:Serine aminopeptidase S33 domain-containing protein n=1 Tax=Haemaphysalis longicornis TaxID=44386 RepID=A0A9J6FKN0_HAELO|nr:hypothetical protein HPB48_018274 [Haemaphysalis longicornis]